MNKLEVGMYVRLNNSVYNTVVINRIANVYKHTILTENDGSMYEGEYSKEEIIKASYNIIDLIEVGDYVNGCYVTNRQASHNEGITIISKRIGIIKCNAYFNQGNYDDCEFKWIEEEDIKSIVTKEQFEQMKYEVE